MDIKTKVKWGIATIVLITLVVLYKTYNPSENFYFPKCPFREFTGLKCPGCGSQRAVHNLLNLNISKAFNKNALLVLSIPYILLGILYNSIKKPGEKALEYRKILFGQKAILIILITIITFWVLRNLIE